VDIKTVDGRKHITISPGEYFITKENAIITTLLGSCIAICLFDSKNNIIGMNHFLNPKNNSLGPKTISKKERGRYGDTAMMMLLDDIICKGAYRKRLQAKVFGGAALMENQSQYFGVGQKNVDYAISFLEKENIPIVSSDVKGTNGRVIHFFNHSFKVMLKNVQHS